VARNKPLSRAEIFQIAWEIRDHAHDPEDARQLLQTFCELFDNKESIPLELLQHLRDAFHTFLETEKLPPGQSVKIDTALGLTPGEKRRKFDDREETQIATEFWKLRLNGVTYQAACSELAEKHECGKTMIGEIWAGKKIHSLMQLRLDLRKDGNDLTPEQMKVAEKMMAKAHEAVANLLGEKDTPGS
jgi:hypothetical protein